jgi:hypothetical protein
MKQQIIKLSPVLLLISAIFSCKKDPEPVNESELITTMVYSLITSDSTEGAPTDIANFVFRDLDGDGPNAPVIIKDTLLANKTYYAIVTLLNESVSPIENINEEILEEGADHQFFYEKSGLNNIAFSYTPLEKDVNGNPIGITTILESGVKGNGTIKITLRHEPNKYGLNVASGEIINAGGETDIEVSFPVTIK